MSAIQRAGQAPTATMWALLVEWVAARIPWATRVVPPEAAQERAAPLEAPTNTRLAAIARDQRERDHARAELHGEYFRLSRLLAADMEAHGLAVVWMKEWRHGSRGHDRYDVRVCRAGDGVVIWRPDGGGTTEGDISCMRWLLQPQPGLSGQGDG